MNLEPVFLAAGLASAGSLLVLMSATLFVDRFRFWPPDRCDGKWLSYWFLASVNMASIIGLAILQFQSVNIRFIAGMAVGISGILLTLAGIFQLGLLNTSGTGSKLVEEGVYSYSRNPQVVGNLVSLAGITAAFPSFEMRTLAVVTALWLFAMVYAEEVYMRGKYGKEYLEYCDETPRFL